MPVSLSCLGLRKSTCTQSSSDHGVRLEVEPLEERTLLSTIVWGNRGTVQSDRDGFNAVFGSQAAAARNVVDAALRSWAQVIDRFNYADRSNVFTVNLLTQVDAPGNGGESFAASRYDTTGKPMQANILIESGTDGHGQGWWIDPTPDDSAEFEGYISNPYAGDAQAGSPARGLNDLFTVVVHEMSHVLGLTGDPASALQRDANRYLTPTNRTDAYFGAGKLYTFTGPSVQALLTSYNRFSPDGDFGRPLHTAEPANSFANSGGIGFFGAQDSNNAQYEYGRRYLPSYLDALILKDAYGYTLAPSTSFATFQSVLNRATGELLIRGSDYGVSDDAISVRKTGTSLQVTVQPGNQARGTGPVVALASTYTLADVRSIAIRSGNGNDTIRIDGLGSAIPISVDAGDGNDSILLGDGQVLKSLDAGAGTDTLDLSAFRQGVVVNLTTGKASMVTVSFRGVENVTGGLGNDTLYGDGANNILRGGDGDDLLYGGGGADQLFGGAGRDVLIGGLGADLLQGDGDDDLLIGGTTAFDADVARLAAILTEWSRRDQTYQQRIDHLVNGGGRNLVNGVLVSLTPTAVIDDSAVDSLSGGSGLDWFWAARSGLAIDLLADNLLTERIG